MRQGESAAQSVSHQSAMCSQSVSQSARPPARPTQPTGRQAGRQEGSQPVVRAQRAHACTRAQPGRAQCVCARCGERTSGAVRAIDDADSSIAPWLQLPYLRSSLLLLTRAIVQASPAPPSQLGVRFALRLRTTRTQAPATQCIGIPGGQQDDRSASAVRNASPATSSDRRCPTAPRSGHLRRLSLRQSRLLRSGQHLCPTRPETNTSTAHSPRAHVVIRRHSPSRLLGLLRLDCPPPSFHRHRRCSAQSARLGSAMYTAVNGTE